VGVDVTFDCCGQKHIIELILFRVIVAFNFGRILFKKLLKLGVELAVSSSEPLVFLCLQPGSVFGDFVWFVPLGTAIEVLTDVTSLWLT
jgi:hypothetical protein